MTYHGMTFLSYTAGDHTDHSKQTVTALVKDADTIRWEPGGQYDAFVLTFDDGAIYRISAHYRSGPYLILSEAAKRRA